MNSLEEILAQTCEAVRPSERLTVSESAEKYRYLNNPGSFVGYWDNSVAPYLVEPMDVLTSLEFTGMIFAGPARCGKSDLFFNWLAHTAICDPADMMMVLMTQNVARDWSVGDLRKNFRNTKELGARVAPGRNSMAVHDVRFNHGMRLLVKWPTITELSGKTIPRLWLADYDRMTQNVDKEGAPYFLTKKRAQTFGRFGMTVAESSPGFLITDPKWIANTAHEAPPTEGILSLYNRGDRRRWYWKCPWCKDTFEPDFSLIKWPDSADKLEAAEESYMCCPHCGGVIGHDNDHRAGVPGKTELNSRAKWIKDGQLWLPDNTIVGTPVRSDTASFWLKGPAASFVDWKTLVYNYLQAEADFERTGSEEALKVTVNVDQGLPYRPKSAESDRLPETLKARAKDLGEKVVPEGVRFLVAAVDVQKNRFVVQVHGFGEGGDVWIIDRFELKKSERKDEDGERFWINPGAYPEDWKLLIPNVIEKTYPLSDGSGRKMQIKAIGCDSGGKEGVTKNAYDFWRHLRDETDGHHMRFQLVKGVPTKTAPRVHLGYPDSDRKDRHAGARGEIPVLFVNSNMVKDQVNVMLDRVHDKGGRVFFPDWLEDWFYKELTVERRTEKGWETPAKARNEAWDLLAYAIAMSLSRQVRIEQINWEDPPNWAGPWDVNDLVSDGEGNKRFASQPNSDYTLSKLAETLA